MAATAGHTNSLLHVTDRSTGRRFLVDTRAELSVLSPSALETHTRSRGPTLRAANGSTIRTYGTRRAQIQIGKEKFHWRFILASVGTTLLGADFFRAHGLLVDIKGKRLVNALMFHSTQLDTDLCFTTPYKRSINISA
ncbi:retroviral-like aspartic protease 1 isoform X3 [Narcine bancroftii]|uniref:retroviral-like aspartic protease 1 isoform X3 n=1 Tax=Narcine bancroftii TaxID=1343680 RepID=UPI00383218A7